MITGILTDGVSGMSHGGVGGMSHGGSAGMSHGGEALNTAFLGGSWVQSATVSRRLDLG